MAEHREEPARHEEGVDAHFGVLDDVGIGFGWRHALRVPRTTGPARAAKRQRAERSEGLKSRHQMFRVDVLKSGFKRILNSVWII